MWRSDTLPAPPFSEIWLSCSFLIVYKNKHDGASLKLKDLKFFESFSTEQVRHLIFSLIFSRVAIVRRKGRTGENVINRQKRNKILQLIVLFVVMVLINAYSLVVYGRFDRFISASIGVAIPCFIFSSAFYFSQKRKNTFIKIIWALFGIPFLVCCSLLTAISPLDHIEDITPYSTLWSFVMFMTLCGIVLFYIIFSVLFCIILSDKKVVPDIMKKRMRNKIKLLLLLFGVSVALYCILDICIGKTAQYIMAAPLIPQREHLSYSSCRDLFDIIILVWRIVIFMIVLCLWSYPIFLFHIVLNTFLKGVFCFLEAVNAFWFALWTWAAVYGWVSDWPRSLWPVVEESHRPYVFAGISVFYIGFAVALY